jgi:hypothetical protein
MKGIPNHNLRYIAEQEGPVTTTGDLMMWPVLSLDCQKGTEEMHLPSLCLLHAIQFDNTPWSEEQFSRCVMNIYDLSIIALNQSIKHIDVCAPEYQQTSCNTTISH